VVSSTISKILSSRFGRTLNSYCMNSTSRAVDAKGKSPDTTSEALTGTKLKIVEAALRTLKSHGFAGSSARAIAAEGDFNQALIFYHFGSVRVLLLAVLDLISARRVTAYADAFDAAQAAPELARLARTIYDEDLQNGYITVLGEIVSAGLSDETLGVEIAARLQPWIDMVQRKADQLLAGSPLKLLVSPRDLAFGLVALYFGVDMLSHLQRDRAPAESLLDLGGRLAVLADTVLTPQPKDTR
jgi:AcrR family transcriptional regulator